MFKFTGNVHWYILYRIIKKITASLNDGLNPLAELPAGLGHGVPQEVGHDVRDLRLQGGGSVVGAPVDIPLKNAPNVIVQEVAVWVLGGHFSFYQRSCET